MSQNHWWKDTGKRKPMYPKENFSTSWSTTNPTHIDWSEIEPGALRLQPDDQSFSCRTGRIVLSDLKFFILWYPDQFWGPIKLTFRLAMGEPFIRDKLAGPSVPCRRFAACKRSLQLCGSRIVDGICRNISRPRSVPPYATGGLSRRWTWRHLAEKVETSKGGGKQWQPTPKNLTRMQWTSAIPVAWLGSGSC
jgi:hypothetical protein